MRPPAGGRRLSITKKWCYGPRNAPPASGHCPYSRPAPKPNRGGRPPVSARIARRLDGALPLLGHLELLPQQAGGEEPAALPVEPGRNRQADGGRPRLRRAAVREAERLRDMGGSRTAQGHSVQFRAPARIGVQMYSQGIRCKMIANLQSYALTINQGDE